MKKTCQRGHSQTKTNTQIQKRIYKRKRGGKTVYFVTVCRKCVTVRNQRRAAACDRVTAEILRRDAEVARLREALERIHKMAKNPMHAWETGDCIDSVRVDEICDEALSATVPGGTHP